MNFLGRGIQDGDKMYVDFLNEETFNIYFGRGSEKIYFTNRKDRKIPFKGNKCLAYSIADLLVATSSNALIFEFKEISLTRYVYTFYREE